MCVGEIKRKQNNEFKVLQCGSGLIPEPLIINWVDFSPTLRVPYMKFCSLSKSQCDIWRNSISYSSE